MKIGDSFESAMKRGKYDAECEAAFRATEAKGVLLIVYKGKQGDGFSAILPANMVGTVSNVLREVADSIEKDMKQATGN